MPGKGVQKNVYVSILTPEQREKLRQFKIQTRIDNERYLRSHPEVEEVIGDFLRVVFLQRPSDICDFAADYFANLKAPTDNLVKENLDME